MHGTLTDFRDLARSVMDTGTKRPFWLLEDRALLLWKPTMKAAHRQSPLLCTLLNKATLCTSSLGIVPLVINGKRAKKKKNLVGNRCKFNLQLIGMTFGSGWGMCQPLWFLCLAWYMAAGTIFSFSFTGMLGLHCAVQFGKEEQGPWRHCSQDFIFSPHLLHDFTVRGIRFYVFFTPESSGPWLWQPSWNCWRGTRILL